MSTGTVATPTRPCLPRYTSRDRLSYIGVSAVCLFFAWALLKSQTAFTDLLLKIGGEFTTGVVTETRDEERTGPNDRTGVAHVLVYKFTARDGRDYFGTTDATNEIEGAKVLVEYLPRYPSINSHRESRELESWPSLLVRSGFGVLALGLCLWPIGYFVAGAIRNRRAASPG